MVEKQKKKDDRGNLKLPTVLHKELLHYTVDEDITLAEVVQRAWDALRTQDLEPTIKSGGVSFSVAERPYVEALLFALRDGSPEVKAVVVSLLRPLLGKSQARSA